MDLRSAVEAGWEHQLELLRALVRSPSTLGHERDAQELVAAELADIGLSPQMWDVGDARSRRLAAADRATTRRPNVTAMRRGTGGGRSLTFNGHIDVVPVGVERTTGRYDPWGAEIADGRMYGRGAADMKAGVVAMLGALRALRAACELRGDAVRRDRDRGGVHRQRRRGLPRARTAHRRRADPRAVQPRSRCEAQVGVLWATRDRRGPGGARRARRPGRQRGPEGAAGDRGDPRTRARGQRGRRALRAELQRRRRAGRATGRHRCPEECVLEVRLRRCPGEDLEAVKARFEAAVDARVEWRGFHAHGFALTRERAALRRPRPRAHESVHGAAAGVPRLHRHDRRARVRGPRRDAGDVLRPDRRQPARAGRVGGPGERASDTTLVLALAGARSGAARARRRSRPPARTDPSTRARRRPRRGAIVFATSSPGRTAPDGDRAQHPVVVAHRHPVDAEHAQLVRDHPRHRQRDRALVAEQEPDLHVAAAPAQAADRVRARHRRPSASIDTCAPPPVSVADRRDRLLGDGVLGAQRARPRELARRRCRPRSRALRPPSRSSPRRARRRRSRAPPPTRPRAPAPCTCSAAQAVMNRQPSDAASTSPSSSGTATRFRSARGSATYSANEPQAVKPGWKSRSQICVSPSRHGSQIAAAAAERDRHALADLPAAHRGPDLGHHAAELVAAARAAARSTGSWPIQPCQSLRQTPVARTSTTTPSGAAGRVRRRSRSSGAARRQCITAARIALLSRAWTR